MPQDLFRAAAIALNVLDALSLEHDYFSSAIRRDLPAWLQILRHGPSTAIKLVMLSRLIKGKHDNDSTTKFYSREPSVDPDITDG